MFFHNISPKNQGLFGGLQQNVNYMKFIVELMNGSYGVDFRWLSNGELFHLVYCFGLLAFWCSVGTCKH